MQGALNSPKTIEGYQIAIRGLRYLLRSIYRLRKIPISVSDEKISMKDSLSSDQEEHCDLLISTDAQYFFDWLHTIVDIFP